MNRKAYFTGGRIALLGLAFLACAVTFARAPAGPVSVRVRSSEEKIRATMLMHTPLGSTKSSVLEFINTRLEHEGIAGVSTSGAHRRNSGAGVADHWIGTSAVNELEVGHYGEWRYLLLIKTYVYLSWGFDANDRLIEVIVYKEMDGL